MQEKFRSATSSARPSLYKLRPDLPPAVDDWVAHALALNREERFQNVRALWLALESALQLDQGRNGFRPRLWSAAKGAVQKLVRGSEPVSPVARAFGGIEPSFTREALARSAYRISAVPEATIELSDADLQPMTATLGATASRPVENTVLVDDADLIVESRRPSDED